MLHGLLVITTAIIWELTHNRHFQWPNGFPTAETILLRCDKLLSHKSVAIKTNGRHTNNRTSRRDTRSGSWSNPSQDDDQAYLASAEYATEKFDSGRHVGSAWKVHGKSEIIDDTTSSRLKSWFKLPIVGLGHGSVSSGKNCTVPRKVHSHVVHIPIKVEESASLQ